RQFHLPDPRQRAGVFVAGNRKPAAERFPSDFVAQSSEARTKSSSQMFKHSGNIFFVVILAKVGKRFSNNIMEIFRPALIAQPADHLLRESVRVMRPLNIERLAVFAEGENINALCRVDPAED